MGATAKHALPREGVLHFIEESAFGTYARPSTSDKGITQYHRFNAQKTKNRLDSLFANPLTRSPSRRVDGKIECEFDLNKEIYTSGSLGVAANGLRVWKNFFGQMAIRWTISIETANDVSTDTWTIQVDSDTPADIVEGTDFSLAAGDNDATATLLGGAIVTEDIDGIASVSVDANVVTLTTGQKDDGTFAESLSVTFSGGAESLVAGVDVKYEPLDDQGSWPCHTVTHWMSTFMRAFTGVAIDEVTINFSGGDVPMIEAKGYAKDAIMTGTGGIDNASGADFELDDDNNTQFEVNSVVAFRATDGTLNTNSGEGYRVTTEGTGTPTVYTVEASHSATDTDIAEPYSPRPTSSDFSNQPRGGAKGFFTKDGTTIYVLEGSVTMRNSHTWLNDHALQESAVGYIPGHFFIEAELTIRAAADEVEHIARYYADASTDYAFVIQVGNTAGDIFEISMPVTELQIETDVASSADETPVTTKMMLYGKATADGSTKALTITEK